MEEDLERLKQRLPLLEYLQQHHWTPCRRVPAKSSWGCVPYTRKRTLPFTSMPTRTCSTVMAVVAGGT
jgi:hypothetical protein